MPMRGGEATLGPAIDEKVEPQPGLHGIDKAVSNLLRETVEASKAHDVQRAKRARMIFESRLGKMTGNVHQVEQPAII